MNSSGIIPGSSSIHEKRDGECAEVVILPILKNGKHRFSQTGDGSWPQNRRGSSPPRNLKNLEDFPISGKEAFLAAL